jgi:acyl-lipid omega-6 desaturase (Delta-12 desaturase)
MDFERHELRALHSRSSVKGIAIFVLDVSLFIGAIAGCLVATSLSLRIAFSIVAGILTSLLFVVGHDACHQSLTARHWLNRLLGTIAFLPCLHPFSLWDLGHNRIHHRFTNRRGKDYVWEPLSHVEFIGLSRFQKLRYRFFRTFAGHFWYYLCEIWWKKMFFPRPSAIGGYRRVYVLDHIVISAWLVIWPATIIAMTEILAKTPPGIDDLALSVLLCCVVPFVVFNLLMSSVIYLHHMNPQVGWVRGDEQVDSKQLQMLSAVHVVFPQQTNLVFHRIMEHPAHHVRPGIPLYNLNDGQNLLETNFPDVIVQKWTLRYHLDTISRCKLFDMEHRCWTGYDGVPTATPRAAVEPDLTRLIQPPETPGARRPH